MQLSNDTTIHIENRIATLDLQLASKTNLMVSLQNSLVLEGPDDDLCARWKNTCALVADLETRKADLRRALCSERLALHRAAKRASRGW